MSEPRVLYVITKGEAGGAQTHVLGLLTSGPAGVSGLVTGSEGPLVDEARRRGHRVWVLPSLVAQISPLADARAVSDIRHVIRDFHPDIVHCHSSKAGVVGRLAAWPEHIPAVFTAHGWAFTEGVPESRRLVALAAERAVGAVTSAVIAVSSYDRALALKARIVRESRLWLIRNGVPDCPARAVPGSGGPSRAQPGSSGPVKIVMVARCGPPKDHLTVLDAASHLRGEWELVFVGDGPLMGRVQQEIERLGLGERVSLLGHRHDVPEILAGAHVFCLASHWEGLPISIIEAMRAGLPVVASAVGGVPELVTFGETGFLVGRKDAGGLERYLQALVDDSALRASLGANGRARYEREFTLDRQMEKVQEVYEFCLGSPLR